MCYSGDGIGEREVERELASRGQVGRPLFLSSPLSLNLLVSLLSLSRALLAAQQAKVTSGLID